MHHNFEYTESSKSRPGPVGQCYEVQFQSGHLNSKPRLCSSGQFAAKIGFQVLRSLAITSPRSSRSNSPSSNDATETPPPSASESDHTTPELCLSSLNVATKRPQELQISSGAVYGSDIGQRFNSSTASVNNIPPPCELQPLEVAEADFITSNSGSDASQALRCPSARGPAVCQNFEVSSASTSDSDFVPPVLQQNPRRTCAGAAPPSLRRSDCHRVFVEGLLTVAASFVHTIWPSSRETPQYSTELNGAGVLPLRVFIQETCRRSRTSYSTIQLTLYYLMAAMSVFPTLDFGREQPRESDIADTVSRDPRVLLGQPNEPSGCRVMQCGRRMFMAALMLASKYLQDRNFSVKAWSKISGLSSMEINRNEKAFLQCIGYRLHLPKEHFENWNSIVFELCLFEKARKPLHYSEILRLLKPDMIRDSTQAQRFVREVQAGKYLAPHTGCKMSYRNNKDDEDNNAGSQTNSIPPLTLDSSNLKVRLGNNLRPVSRLDSQMPLASVYNCPPPRPTWIGEPIISMERSIRPGPNSARWSQSSSSSSPESTMGSIFSDKAEIVSRTRSSSFSSAASPNSLQGLEFDMKHASCTSSVASWPSFPVAADPKEITESSHCVNSVEQVQSAAGRTKRKASTASAPTEKLAASLPIRHKSQQEDSPSPPAEDSLIRSKKSIKKRVPTKPLKAGHTSESVKAKRQQERNLSRMAKNEQQFADASHLEEDFSDSETLVADEEKEHHDGSKQWAEPRKPVSVAHNPNKRYAREAAPQSCAFANFLAMERNVNGSRAWTAEERSRIQAKFVEYTEYKARREEMMREWADSR